MLTTSCIQRRSAPQSCTTSTVSCGLARIHHRSSNTHLRRHINPLLLPTKHIKRTIMVARATCDAGEPDCFHEEDGSVIVRDDLDALLQVLPADIREPLMAHPQRANLLEVVLDLGRRPEARFLGSAGGEYLRDAEITKEDLAHADTAIGEFGGDNRAGVEGTLHRISAIRNRRGTIVGLTCRVGRAVTGHIDMIRDILEAPDSILFLGRPGVGKTTVIREMARVLSDELHKRVVIVDTSNEIGGDGDVPHPAIGSARRMQVPDPSQQHKVMIEAVENHMPEIVIVDEIGTEAEALACRTIAERGVQLIGTAHGQLLENLIKNPTLSDLVGGICSVTLGDEEARSRGTQKSVLERKAPPTFPLVIEMRERAHWVTHWVEDSVDCLLTGKVPIVQVRRRDSSNLAGAKKVVVEETRYDMGEDDHHRSSGSRGGGGDNGINGSSSIGLPSSAPSGAARIAVGNSGGSSSLSGGGGNNNGSDVPDGINSSVFDAMFGYSTGGFGSSFTGPDVPIVSSRMNNTNSGGVGRSDDLSTSSWAARLRDVPDEEALQELAMLGYTDGSSVRRGGVGGDKFSFASAGTNGKKKRRNSLGRAVSSPAKGNRRR